MLNHYMTSDKESEAVSLAPTRQACNICRRYAFLIFHNFECLFQWHFLQRSCQNQYGLPVLNSHLFFRLSFSHFNHFFFQSCWPTRDHIGRPTGISNLAWHLPQVVPRVVQTTGSVHPQPILPNCLLCIYTEPTTSIGRLIKPSRL